MSCQEYTVDPGTHDHVGLAPYPKAELARLKFALSLAPSNDNRASAKFVPEEVSLAVEFSFPGEAFLGEITFAVTTLDTFDMPGPVQHIEKKAVQDGPFAASAMDHHD